MVDQQDRFYREVLELSRNNTSKHNVLYSKEKVDELIDKVLHAKIVLKKCRSILDMALFFIPFNIICFVYK